MLVTFDTRQELTPTIWEYRFMPEGTVDFVPGQYVDLHLNGTSEDPRGASRTFTLTSLPTDPDVSFLLKILPDPSPYKQVLASLKPGDQARIDDAMGDLVLPKDPSLPLVFIAGGIGIASYLSMFKQLLHDKQERSIFFYYALRDRRELLFKELLRSYPLALNTTVVAPNRLSARQVLDSSPPDSLLYISGSQPFVEGLRLQFEQIGIPRSQIVFDFFDGYAEL